MAQPTAITTGEQSVTTTGAVTGSLSTASLSGDFSISIRVRGLAAGKSMQIVVEDTANASQYSDVTQVASHTFSGETIGDGATITWRQYEIPMMRFGVTNSAVRVNVQQLSSSPGTVFVLAELWQ